MVRLQRAYSSAILGIEMQGRQVVVTGGAGALGGAVVQAFVDAGAVVHVPVREVRLRMAWPAFATWRGSI